MVIKRLEDIEFSRIDVFNMIQESMQERVAQGVVYSICKMTCDYFVQYTKNALIFIAIDPPPHTLSLSTYRNTNVSALLGAAVFFLIGIKVMTDGRFWV